MGGSFHYLPGDERHPLLLVAGGIGIKPLFSILKHCWEVAEAGMPSSSSSSSSAGSSIQTGQSATALDHPAAAGAAAAHRPPPHAALLYSASMPAELAFRQELEQLQAQGGGSFRLQLHATAPEWRGRAAEWGGHWGRIGRPQLQAALQWLLGRCTEAAFAAGDPSSATIATSRSCCGSGSSGEPAAAAVAALVCGPAAMEDAVVADLLSLGLNREHIRFERW